MKSWRMRPASLSDIDKMVETITPDIGSGHFEITTPDDFRTMIERCINEAISGAHPREVLTAAFVIEVDGTFAGFAVVRDNYFASRDPVFPENTKELWILSISENMRGHGLGKKCTIDLMQKYSQQHLIAYCKEPSGRMIGILTSLGFIRMGKLRYSPDVTLLFFDRGGSLSGLQEKLRVHNSLAIATMSMQTNLGGRLRNTSLPLTAGLLPLFEAVVNSIHGIEEAGLSPETGRIVIEVLRKPKQERLQLERAEKKAGPAVHEDIVGFKVTDNGIGFTDANMQSFETLDTDYKAAKGGRGIGRLVWLKAFGSVHVLSVYKATNQISKRRKFDFDAGRGVTPISDEKLPSEQAPETTIHLDDFKAAYRDNSRKTLNAISESILEHCLWYFVRPGGGPHISLHDNGDAVQLDALYEAKMHSSASTQNLEIGGRTFELTHVKLRSNLLGAHALAFCAQNRVVTEEKLAGKVSGLHGRLSDASGEFVYECYVRSTLLDDAARPERTGFDIVEEPDPLFETSDLSLQQIRSAVIEQAAAHLAPYLSESMQRSKQRIESFITKRAPRYRPIMARIPQQSLNVDPDISDKELELILHKFLADIEGQLLAEGHEIMTAGNDENYPEYRKRLAAYLCKAEDIKRSDLANYVSHRKVILDLLQMAIQRSPGGDYAREDLIHNLIMPMGTTSCEVMPDNCNLWLVDERLAFHDYLASDKTLTSMPITGSNDMKEPDLCALNVFNNPILVSEGSRLPLASIVVVEIKRPMRNDAKAGEVDDPVEQAIGYLNRIRRGQVQTPQGRPIPESQDIPGFCYVLADITPKMAERCEVHHDLKVTHDKMGFFGYKTNCNAFIEVISFDRLVNAARERNRAFFDKLGLPAN